MRATKAGLEYVPDRTAERLVLISEGGLEGVHPFAEVSPRGGQDQVEVVGHDREGVKLPGEAPGSDEDGFQEDLFGGIGFEDRLAELGAVVDVVSALVGDETAATGHGRIV